MTYAKCLTSYGVGIAVFEEHQIRVYLKGFLTPTIYDKLNDEVKVDGEKREATEPKIQRLALMLSTMQNLFL